MYNLLKLVLRIAFYLLFLNSYILFLINVQFIKFVYLDFFSLVFFSLVIRYNVQQIIANI